MIELLFIGNELLDGRVINTNQNTIAQCLHEQGFFISQTTTISDNYEDLVQTIHRISKHASVIITTGGLGPTDDDRTSAAVSDAFNKDLVRDTAVVESLKAFFKTAGKPFSDSNLKQADFPKGAFILPNSSGTAPGFALLVEQTWLFCLPGVPKEMIKMLNDHVLPMIQQHCAQLKQFHQSCLFKCIGCGESQLADRLSTFYPLPSAMDISFQVKFPEVHIRLHNYSEKNTDAFQDLSSQLKVILNDVCYTQHPHRNYIHFVIDFLKSKQYSISLAESCTGGQLSHIFTSMPGASDFFDCAVVCYSNKAKTSLCDVNPTTIKTFGAVSKEVANEMAIGCRHKNNTDIAVSITGIAGPSGGSPDKPVGTVFIGISTPTGTTVFQHHIVRPRLAFQTIVAYKALSHIIECA